MIQDYDFPERLIGADPEYYLRAKMGKFSTSSDVFTPDAMAEYLRCFSDPATIHASCEDYRAAAGIDLDHDEADLTRRLECPVLALWGPEGRWRRITTYSPRGANGRSTSLAKHCRAATI